MVTISELYDRYYAKQKQGDTLQAKWQAKANAVCELFNVRRAIVKLSNRMDVRAKYFGRIRTLRIGEHCWGGIEDAFHHEIAHHIVRERFGRVKSHGRQFKRILWDIVCKCYPNPQSYKWECDYKNVKRYADKKIAKTKPKEDTVEATEPIPVIKVDNIRHYTQEYLEEHQ